MEIEGPIVIIRLGGRFWHKRSDVVQRVANYLIGWIPTFVMWRSRTRRNWTTRDEARRSPVGSLCPVIVLSSRPARARQRALPEPSSTGASAKVVVAAFTAWRCAATYVLRCFRRVLLEVVEFGS